MEHRFGARTRQADKDASWLSGKEAWTMELILKAVQWSRAWMPATS